MKANEGVASDVLFGSAKMLDNTSSAAHVFGFSSLSVFISKIRPSWPFKT